MKKLSLKRTPLAVVFASLLLLAACGGGGGGGDNNDNVSGTDVPNSATSSSEGAISFIKTVTASSSATADPITVGDVTLATSNTDEPDSSI